MATCSFASWQFPSFRGPLEFVNQVAVLAEKFDHHPDILLSYRDVRLELSTHSDGGLTDKDFAFASEVNARADGPVTTQKPPPTDGWVRESRESIGASAQLPGRFGPDWPGRGGGTWSWGCCKRLAGRPALIFLEKGEPFGTGQTHSGRG